MDNNTVSTRNQIYWNTLLRLPLQAILFVNTIFTARLLTPKDYGIMGIAMMLIGYAGIFTSFGLVEAIVQRCIKSKSVLNSIFTINFLVSCFLSITFFIGSPYIANFFNSVECKNVLRVLSFGFVIGSFSGIPYGILRRDLNFKAIAIIEACGSLCMSFMTLLLAYVGFEYWSLVYGQMIPGAIFVFVVCVKAKWMPRFSYENMQMKGIYDFGIWNFIRNQIIFASTHVDKFVLGKWSGSNDLGYYDRAMSIAILPYQSVTMNINGVMFSSFSINKNDKNILKESFSKSLSLIALINFPINAGLLVIAPYFVTIFLGSDWTPMIVPLQIISAGFFLKVFSGMTASMNIGIGNYRKHTIIISFVLILFIVCCMSLIQYNVIGIALSYLIYCTGEFLVLMNMCLRSINLKWRDVLLAIYPGAAGSFLMLSVTYILSFFVLPELMVINMIFIIMTGVICYGAFILFDKTDITKSFKVQFWNDFKMIISKR